MNDPNRTLIDRYAAGAAKLREAASGLSDAQLDALPIPGTWSIRTIVVHLMHAEIFLVAPGPLSVARGATSNLLVQLTRRFGATADVTFTIEGLPAGVTATLPAPAGGVNGINEATCIIVSGVSVQRNIASCGGTRLLLLMV